MTDSDLTLLRTHAPGINIVVREIVFTLELAYNVRRAWGVRYGWRGFFDDAAKEWLELAPLCGGRLWMAMCAL